MYGAFVMIGAPSHFLLDGGALFIPLHYISGHGLSSTSLSFRWWRSFHSLHSFSIFCVCIMYVFSVCFLGTMSLAYICWRSSYSFQVSQHCFSVLLFKLDCAVHVSSLSFRWRRSFRTVFLGGFTRAFLRHCVTFVRFTTLSSTAK